MLLSAGFRLLAVVFSRFFFFSPPFPFHMCEEKKKGRKKEVILSASSNETCIHPLIRKLVLLCNDDQPLS